MTYLPVFQYKTNKKDFRICQSLIQKLSSPGHVFPPHPQTTYHETLAGKNVQRGLAAKLQDLSATFRKKQRVYMESEFVSFLLRPSPLDI